MRVSGMLVDALKAGILLNEKLTTLIDKAEGWIRIFAK